MVLRGAAERALLYLTNVNGDGTLFNVRASLTRAAPHAPLHMHVCTHSYACFYMQTVLASVNAETQRFLSEYARRVLVRMDMDSDEEEEDADL